MNAIRTSILALAGLLGLTSASGAQDPYHLAGLIRNDTKMTITYQYKIDAGAWTTTSLAPGQQHVFSMPYNQANLNRVTGIRFDCVLNDGKAVTFQNTTLARYCTKNPNQGWMQRFIVTNDGKNLHLAR